MYCWRESKESLAKIAWAKMAVKSEMLGEWRCSALHKCVDHRWYVWWSLRRHCKTLLCRHAAPCWHIKVEIAGGEITNTFMRYGFVVVESGSGKGVERAAADSKVMTRARAQWWLHHRCAQDESEEAASDRADLVLGLKPGELDCNADNLIISLLLVANVSYNLAIVSFNSLICLLCSSAKHPMDASTFFIMSWADSFNASSTCAWEKIISRVWVALSWNMRVFSGATFSETAIGRSRPGGGLTPTGGKGGQMECSEQNLESSTWSIRGSKASSRLSSLKKGVGDCDSEHRCSWTPAFFHRRTRDLKARRLSVVRLLKPGGTDISFLIFRAQDSSRKARWAAKGNKEKTRRKSWRGGTAINDTFPKQGLLELLRTHAEVSGYSLRNGLNMLQLELEPTWASLEPSSS